MIRKQKVDDRLPSDYSGWLIALGTLVTIIAQFVTQLSFLFIIIWIVYVIMTGLSRRNNIYFSKYILFYIYLILLLGIICCSFFVITGESDYVFGLFQVIAKSMLMYLVGLFSFSKMGAGEQPWKRVFLLYVVGSAAYLAWVFINYFPGFSAWMSSEAYLFSQKNSLGQICGVASVLLVFLALENKKTVLRLICATGSAVFWVGILIFQCRTAAIAVALAACAALLIGGKKNALVAAGALVLVVVACYPEAQDFLTHGFFLDKYSGQDANAMSSGRLTLWSDALVAWGEHPFTGVGDYYVDNMYVNTLVNIGFIGFAVLMVAWISRVIVNFRRTSITKCYCQNGWIFRLVASLTVFYLVESMLEGYPPFGPGTCSFLFWMLCGCADACIASGAVLAHGGKRGSAQYEMPLVRGHKNEPV